MPNTLPPTPASPPNAQPSATAAATQRPGPTTQEAAWRTAGVWLVVVLALLGVFAMYRQPEFLLTLADQLWSCF